METNLIGQKVTLINNPNFEGWIRGIVLVSESGDYPEQGFATFHMALIQCCESNKLIRKNLFELKIIS